MISTKNLLYLLKQVWFKQIYVFQWFLLKQKVQFLIGFLTQISLFLHLLFKVYLIFNYYD